MRRNADKPGRGMEAGRGLKGIEIDEIEAIPAANGHESRLAGDERRLVKAKKERIPPPPDLARIDVPQRRGAVHRVPFVRNAEGKTAVVEKRERRETNVVRERERAHRLAALQAAHDQSPAFARQCAGDAGNEAGMLAACSADTVEATQFLKGLKIP